MLFIDDIELNKRVYYTKHGTTGKLQNRWFLLLSDYCQRKGLRIEWFS